MVLFLFYNQKKSVNVYNMHLEKLFKYHNFLGVWVLDDSVTWFFIPCYDVIIIALWK